MSGIHVQNIFLKPVNADRIKYSANKTETDVAFLGIQYRSNLSKDIISFSGQKKKKTKKRKNPPTEAYLDLTYRNILNKPLKSSPNPNFINELTKIPNIVSLEDSKTRISSLSRYLKEDMIGFIVPDYEYKGEVKGGYEWFARGLENLLKGCKKGAKFENYPIIAKDFFGLLATYDSYWKSPEYVEYLKSLKQREKLNEGQLAAINAAQLAVKELQQPNEIAFASKQLVKMYGYFSPLKGMDKILNDGCAYTGEKLKFDDPIKGRGFLPANMNASLEHIVPESWDGASDDSNYLVVSSESNSLRGNMSLIKYLKGNNDINDDTYGY
ncbi:MAG: hypothetical protein A2255_10445 [Candidatus Melainabacteria bacterium RIFOXYA2_FULL_32_9]|nr:MAG: hypothetical protein A2255_10445 [Candidatus Melainabacteria bacterium RIFOXYA2_FULL_32_9]